MAIGLKTELTSMTTVVAVDESTKSRLEELQADRDSLNDVVSAVLNIDILFSMLYRLWV